MRLKSFGCDFVEEIDGLEFAVEQAEGDLRWIVFGEVLEREAILTRLVAPVVTKPKQRLLCLWI